MALRLNDSNAVVSLFYGRLSGIAASTAKFPLDLVKRRVQLYGVAGAAPIDKSSIAGTFGFYRGIVPEYLKVVPRGGIAFMNYEVLKSLFSIIWMWMTRTEVDKFVKLDLAYFFGFPP